MGLLKIFLSSVGNEIAKRNPLFSLSATLLQEKISSPLPNWMSERIERDLSFFSKPDVEKTLSNIERSGNRSKAYLHRFVIRNNRLVTPTIRESLKHPRLRKMVFFMRQALQKVAFPDVEFLFSLRDLYEDPDLLECTEAPVFLISKTEENEKTALIPHVEWMNQWSWIRTVLEREIIPWEDKKELLFWRGSTTGERVSSGSNVRHLISQLGERFSGDMDVGFCYLTQNQSDIVLKKPMRIEDQIRYKYLIALDGNCFPGSFFWQLSSGSLVFKQSSPYLEWYYGGLEKDVHYLPFSSDGSDLLMKKKWAQENDSEAEKIAARSKEFADQYLTNEGLVAYTYHLLSGLSKKGSKISSTPV